MFGNQQRGGCRTVSTVNITDVATDTAMTRKLYTKETNIISLYPCLSLEQSVTVLTIVSSILSHSISGSS
jgi:hypothetical protein